MPNLSIPRDTLAKFLPDQRSIRAIEQVLETVGNLMQPPVTLGPEATDLASVIALANAIRAALIANGIGQA